jgi:hypothetical protein
MRVKFVNIFNTKLNFYKNLKNYLNLNFGDVSSYIWIFLFLVQVNLAFIRG